MSAARHFGQRAEWILDPRRGFVKFGRHRFVWHWFDDEPWRDQDCPGCGKRFIEDPRFSCSGTNLHMECEFAGLHTHYDDETGEPTPTDPIGAPPNG
jgi:hypothetical protein